MGASSVTGKGFGHSNKLSVKELAILENGPQIIFCGHKYASSNSTSPPSSPPSSGINTVYFPYPLPTVTNFSVFLTTEAGGKAFVTSMNTDSDEKFIGFSFTVESACNTMYMVVKNGIRPQIDINK